jgi:hypothetical protein
MELFESVSSSKQSTPAILLIDSSGSVRSDFGFGQTIFDKMEDIVKSIDNEQFRLIFWNSDRTNDEANANFPNGVFQPMHVIAKTVMKQPFQLAKSRITQYCLTFPHLGFDAIPKGWISDKEATHIYFVTDGQIGYSNCDSYTLSSLKSKLSSSIRKLFSSHNNVHLHIVTVENKNQDFDQSETLNVMAGGDVFNVIKNDKLTNYITEFVSYTPNKPEGYHHINTIIPPAGYVPFNQKCFSETKTNQFVRYIIDLVKSNKDDEDQLLKIVQSLSASIRVLTKDKPLTIVGNIVKTFCNMFMNTVLDPTMVEFILADTIRLEKQGQTAVFSEYRSKMKDFYKQAQQLIQQNTQKAIGLDGEFISFPIDGKIVTGHSNMVSETIRLNKAAFPSSSVKINNLTIPVVPLLTQNPSPIADQCLRQYIRAIISRQYNIDEMGDVVIYMVLGIVLRVVANPNVNEKVKQAYRHLGNVMMRKKRLNSDATEISRLEEGELPVPNNGKIESFYGFMTTVSNNLGIKCEPMALWYLMCLALGNKKLETKQYIHCAEALGKSFPNIVVTELLNHVSNLLQPVESHEMPISSTYDYKCIITLEDTTQTGGYKIQSHTSLTGTTCSPIFVISESGFQLMFNVNNNFNQTDYSQNVMCPICYEHLKVEQFEHVEPKKDNDVNIFSQNVNDPFSENSTRQVQQQIQPQQNVQQYSQPQKAELAKKGTLIIMKGTVGAGKTTVSKLLQQKITELGGHCVNEGPDKYCKSGMHIADACRQVTNELKKLNESDNDMLVAIIDTCGEKGLPKNNVHFDVDFTGWKTITVMPNYDKNKQKEYCAWTLRNVLQRSASSKDTDFWLNPNGAGVQTCVTVHKKKLSAILNGKIVLKVDKTDVNGILGEIKELADSYSDYLANTENMSLDAQVESIVRQITK